MVNLAKVYLRSAGELPEKRFGRDEDGKQVFTFEDLAFNKALDAAAIVVTEKNARIAELEKLLNQPRATELGKSNTTSLPFKQTKTKRTKAGKGE